MRKKGWRVSIILWDRSGQMDGSSGDKTTIGLASKTQDFSMLFKLPGLYSRILKTINVLEPDVLFLTHYFLLPLAVFAVRKKSIKVYDAVEFFCLDIPQYFGPFRKPARHLVRMAERVMLNAVDGTLVVDSRDGWFTEYYKQMGQRVEMILNVPAMHAGEYYLNAEDEGVDSGRKIIAYAGAFKNAKGLLTALRVADMVREKDRSVLFEFIGSWQKDKSIIEKEVERLHLHENVRFTGPFAYDEMLMRLSRAVVGLALFQGERYEYMGIGNSRKIFTYMQAGLPIIVSDVGIVCSFLEEIGCGVGVNINSVEKISESVCKYLSDVKLANIHGSTGRNAFREKYYWEKEECKFMTFINAANFRDK